MKSKKTTVSGAEAAGELVLSGEVLADVLAADMTETDLRRFARAGAEAEYAASLRWQARVKRVFPGIDRAATKRLMSDRAAHARSVKQTRQQQAAD